MRSRSNHLPTLIGSLLASLLFFGFVLGASLGRESIYKYLNVFAEVYSLVRGNYVDPVDDGSLLEGAYKGMVGGLDLFSGYLSKAEFSDIQRDPEGGPAETGAEVLRVPGGALIVAVRPGSPAEKAGLRAGEQVWSIDGTPTRLMSLFQVRRSQRGAADSSVQLLVYNPKSHKRQELRVYRRLLEGDPFEARLAGGKVGYLRIANLARAEAEPLRAALGSLKESGATQLLLDLRNCASGSVEDAVRVAGLFLPPGTVAVVQDRGGGRVVKASTVKAFWNLPVAVLGNAGTAGGAEALVAALRDRANTSLLGETTYGLSSVQQIVPLPAGDGLILTSARVLSPAGEGWGKGIKPDVEIPTEPSEEAELGRDAQLEKAFEHLRAATASSEAA